MRRPLQTRWTAAKAASAAIVVLVLAGCGTAAPDAVSVTGSAPPPSPNTTVTASATSPWDEDLDALIAGLEGIHINPWWRIPKSEFFARADLLRKTLPSLDKDAAEVAVMELVATIDGHTSVYPTDLGFHYYGLELYEFSDGVYVIAAPGHPDVVGGRLTSVGGMPLHQVDELVTPLVSYDNNQTKKFGRPLVLVMVEGLVAKGIVGRAGKPRFGITTQSGKHVIVNPEALSWGAYQSQVGWFPVGLPPRDRPLSQSRRTEPIWWKQLPDGVFYVQYNQVRRGVENAVAAIDSAITRPGFRRLVVDLRNNGGGDNTSYGPLLGALEDPRLTGRLSVLVGRETFSAATNFATEVEAETDAVFVGEPTGGRPNLYADVLDVDLPNSGIVVHVSSRYWEFSTPDDKRPAVPVDLPVALSSADYFAGRDPALAAARDPVPRTGAGP